jgi:hypothetical protein
LLSSHSLPKKKNLRIPERPPEDLLGKKRNQGIMGEGITQIQYEVLHHPYLSQRVGLDAATGWGGERVQILKPSGRFCFFTHTHIHFYLM